MAAITAPFHGLSTKFYASTSAIDLGTVGSSEEVGNVSSVGTLELSANIIEYNKYGSGYKSKLVGQKDSGTLDITLNWVPDASTEANQALLKAKYDSGEKLYFAVVWSDPSANNAGATFEGYVASFSVDTPVEDVVSANVQIAIDGAVQFDVDGTLGA